MHTLWGNINASIITVTWLQGVLGANSGQSALLLQHQRVETSTEFDRRCCRPLIWVAWDQGVPVNMKLPALLKV